MQQIFILDFYVTHSLLLLKPTFGVPHMGGLRFKSDTLEQAFKAFAGDVDTISGADCTASVLKLNVSWVIAYPARSVAPLIVMA